MLLRASNVVKLVHSFKPLKIKGSSSAGRCRGSAETVNQAAAKEVSGCGVFSAAGQVCERNFSSQSTPAIVLASRILPDMTILTARESGKKRA